MANRTNLYVHCCKILAIKTLIFISFLGLGCSLSSVDITTAVEPAAKTPETPATETPVTPVVPVAPVAPCNFTPSNYMSASNVVGQPDMASTSANQGLAGIFLPHI